MNRTLRISIIVSSLALAWLTGCGKAPEAHRPAPAASPLPIAAQAAAAGAEESSRDAGQRAELLQKLLERVGQLEKQAVEREASDRRVREMVEKQAADRTEPAQKAQEAVVSQLKAKIAELENKVAAWESGKVLPEIKAAGENGPTAQELDQKIRVIERKNELAAEASEARGKDTPKLSIGQNGLTLSSADTNFVFRLRGLVQADSRTFFGDNPRLQGNDSFLLRRARPIIEGTVFRDIDFQLVPDFGGSAVQIYDAHLTYRLRPELQLRAGKFKSPIGLEQLQSDATLPFNERSLVSDLLPTRAVGLQLGGDIGEGRLSYAIGLFNETGDGRNGNNSDFGDDKEVAGRLFVQPFKLSGNSYLDGLGFGLGGSYSQVSSNALALPASTGGSLPGYWTDGQQQFFAYNPVIGTVLADGTHWRLSPQASYLHGPLGLLGEYIITDQGVVNTTTSRRADLQHAAWQVTGQWVLTGEPASFTGISPRHPFDFRSGGWGAWQLVGRFGQLQIDDAAFLGFSNPAISASSATAWTVGVNWWLNKNLRLLTGFSHTVFEGGGAFNALDATTQNPPATVTHQDENALFTRLQLAF